MSNNIERTVAFEFEGDQYEVSIPTVRQVIRIETLKTTLSEGFYARLTQSKLMSSIIVLDFVDMLSYLSVLCPKLVQKHSLASLEEMDALKAMALLQVYRLTITPWIFRWQQVLSGKDIEAKKTDDAEKTEQ